MFAEIRAAVVTMVLFTLFFGLAYPLAMTGIAGAAFPNQASGSLVRDGAGHVIGSSLIAQAFAKPQYLHPRPSAAGNGYDPTASGGTNLGPMDPALAKRIAGDAASLRKDLPNNGNGADIPADALTTSGSGLDPDVSPANARMQVPRVAKARGIPVAAVQAVIDAATGQPFLGFIGQPHVNVLAVNQALDVRYPEAQPAPR
ncbi:MAG: potassium-transporting ATPase subunit KdpC [Caulobacteraceae bacterium]|nr:potassium-transporting ATPase subunit KdpC [Caulobacteraceae bacterium]